jgi:lipopolysaccharide export LptBFGC system permease protein LptF
MRTLYGHVALRFVGVWAAVTTIVCALITTLKLIEASRSFLQQGAPWSLMGVLALCIALEFGHRLFFVTLLLALAWLSNRMAQTGELLGLAAQGLSPGRLARPLLAVACVLAVAMVLLGDRLLPWAMGRRTALLAQHLGKVEPATLYFQKRSAWYFEEGRLYHLPEVLADGVGFARPSVHVFDGDDRVRLLRADALIYHGADGWVLHNAISYDLGAAGAVCSATLPLPLKIAPAALLTHMGNPRELPHQAAQQLIARRQSSGLDTTVHRLEVFERVAQPVGAPLLLWAVMPWALGQERRRPLGVALCAAVAMVAAVLTVGQILRLLTLAHRLPVLVGASGPLLCALAILCAHAPRFGRQIIFSGRTKRSKVASST